MSLVAHDDVRTILLPREALVLRAKRLVGYHEDIIVARRAQKLVDHALDRLARRIRQRHALDALALVVGLTIDPFFKFVLPVLDERARTYYNAALRERLSL